MEIKLFLTYFEAGQVLENIEDLQHIEIFKELKKEILKKYESQKALEL